MRIFKKRSCLWSPAAILTASLLAGCSTLDGPPPLGRGFMQLYTGTSMMHRGLDIDVPWGAAVRAIDDGEVGFISRDPKEIYLTVQHGDGVSAMYYHLERVVVNERQRVRRGELIGYTGPTGYSSPARERMVGYPHLHLEVYRDGDRFDPAKLNMTCPDQGGRWWWPVACEASHRSRAPAR